LAGVVAAPDDFAGVRSDERGRRTAPANHDGLDVAVDAEGTIAVLDFVGASIHVFRPKI
jgi:hypothetical protein